MERNERTLGTILIVLGICLGLAGAFVITGDEALSLLMGMAAGICLFNGVGLWIVSRT